MHHFAQNQNDNNKQGHKRLETDDKENEENYDEKNKRLKILPFHTNNEQNRTENDWLDKYFTKDYLWSVFTMLSTKVTLRVLNPHCE